MLLVLLQYLVRYQINLGWLVVKHHPNYSIYIYYFFSSKSSIFHTQFECSVYSFKDSNRWRIEQPWFKLHRNLLQYLFFYKCSRKQNLISHCQTYFTQTVYVQVFNIRQYFSILITSSAVWSQPLCVMVEVINIDFAYYIFDRKFTSLLEIDEF